MRLNTHLAQIRLGDDANANILEQNKQDNPPKKDYNFRAFFLDAQLWPRKSIAEVLKTSSIAIIIAEILKIISNLPWDALKLVLSSEGNFYWQNHVISIGIHTSKNSVWGWISPQIFALDSVGLRVWKAAWFESDWEFFSYFTKVTTLRTTDL